MYIWEYILFFIIRSIQFPVLFFLPVFLEMKGISGWKVGFLMGESSIVGIVMALPMGILSDRRQPRSLIIFSIITGAAVMMGFRFNSGFYIFMFLFFFWGLSRYLFQVSFDALFFKNVIGGKGCIHVGRYQSVFSAAIAVGLLIMSGIFNSVPFEYFYMVAAAAFVIALLPASKLSITGVKRIPPEDYRKMIFKPSFILFGGLLFLFALHWGAEDTCYGLFLRHYLGIGYSLSSLYMMSEFAMMAFSSLFIARMVDRYNIQLRWLFVAGIFISGATLILKVNPIFWVSLIMRMIHGIGDSMVMVVLYFGISRVFHLDSIGGNMSAVTFILLSGSLTGAVLYSWIGSVYGYEISFVVSGVSMILIAVVLVLMLLAGYGGRNLNA